MLVYIGWNGRWLVTPNVYSKTETMTKTKAKTDCLKDPTYTTFLESRGLKDIKNQILTNQPRSTCCWSTRPDQIQNEEDSNLADLNLFLLYSCFLLSNLPVLQTIVKQINLETTAGGKKQQWNFSNVQRKIRNTRPYINIITKQINP